jgi:hypothetical protein
VNRPLYFVSSNPHCLVNLLTGFALREESSLVKYVADATDRDLTNEWEDISTGQAKSSRENFLYYALKKYQTTPLGTTSLDAQLNDEVSHGIIRIYPEHTFDIEAQIIDLHRLNIQHFDPRLVDNPCLNDLVNSDAIILNIDYPLGLAMYNILSMVSIHADVRGIYVMGKSASLNSAIGDVIIPTVCQDEHSHNTFFVNNCFNATDVAPYLKFGTVLDNQKAITVLGTFLQNAHITDIFFSEGFADIEMEFGSVCCAIYEATRPKRFPTDEIVNLQDTSLDFGMLHYVSDTPLNRGKNLGAGTLSYFGMDPTYACSIAILHRIFDLECKNKIKG